MGKFIVGTAAILIAMGWTCCARAQSLSSLAVSDPQAEYQVIKASIAALKPGVGLVRGGVYDVGQCDSDWSYAPGAEGDALTWLVVLATQVVSRSNDLRKIGYPSRQWEPVLREYEAVQIEGTRKLKADSDEGENAIKSRARQMFRKLAATLNSDRKNLPRVVVNDECGGTGTTVFIKTQPAGGTVLFIPVFYHNLCKAKKFDPEDRERCDRWQEPLEVGGNAPEFNGNGEYMYVATWQAGKRSGKIDFDKLKSGTTLTIRQSQ
jgi:hypothetical protein